MRQSRGAYASPVISIALACAVLVVTSAAPALATMLHAGDKIQVTVYNHPDLSGPLVVDGAGNVSLPLAGGIEAGGADPAALAQRIRRSLTHYIKNVAVDVQLLAQNQAIFVAGGPGGSVAYTPGATLATVLEQIESPPQTSAVATPATTAAHDLLHGRVDLRKVAVERDGATLGVYDAAAMTSTGNSGPALFPGDTIHFVDKPIRVSVQGEVREPGFAYLTESEPEVNAFTQVGGTLPTAALANIRLHRDGTDRDVAIGRPAFSAPARDGDVITVQRAPTVSVIGAVEKPGQATLHGTPDLLAAVYEAGGPQPKADIKHVAVIHDGTRVEYDLNGITHGTDPRQSNPTLVDGDSVIVPVGHKLDLNSVFQGLYAARLLFP